MTDNLSSSSHVSKRLALSQAAFASIRRLSPPDTGLAPHLAHRLSYSLLLPILLYGADLLIPTRGLLIKMEIFWRQVRRWVMNCFRSTPTAILAAESCLPPVSVLAAHRRSTAALRLVCSPPSINPASARLHRSFPTLLATRAPDSHPSLCTRLPPNVMPLDWRTPLPKPPVRTHLPVDALAHLTTPLLEGLSFTPLCTPHLLPETDRLPAASVMLAAYRGLQGRARLQLMNDWASHAPTPDYYTFPLRLQPHPFMVLGKFMAGRIHQMRAQKSYLAAHPSWADAHLTRICPRCGVEPETFSRAILRCSARAQHSARYLQGVSSLDPDAPIWSSSALLRLLSTFIRLTRTNFPPDMLQSSSPSSDASMVLPSPTSGPLPWDLTAPSPSRPI